MGLHCPVLYFYKGSGTRIWVVPKLGFRVSGLNIRCRKIPYIHKGPMILRTTNVGVQACALSAGFKVLRKHESTKP